MKKIKLFALTAFAMLSTNAFAATVVDEPGFSKNGVLYELSTTTEGDVVTRTARVIGVNTSATDAMQKTIAILSEVTGDLGTYKVTEIAEDWEAATSKKDVTGVTTSLTIDVTNLKAALASTAYDGFTKLEKLTITDSNAAKDAKTTTFDGGLNNATKATLKEVSLSSNINTLGVSAFNGFSKLATINLANVKTYGTYALTNTALTAVDLTNAETIGQGAFAWLGIEELTIPAGVKTIAKDAFKGDTKLAKVTINGTDESTVTEIGDWFSGDAAIVEIVVNAPKIATLGETNFPANAFTKIDLENTAIKDIAKLDLSKAAKSLTEIKLPAKLTGIADSKFKGFEKLASITIPETVTTIGNDAFNGSGLTSIAIAKGVTSIGLRAFRNCGALETVTGMEAVTEITGLTFGGCKALISVEIGAKVAGILQQAFDGCKALKTVTNNSTVLKKINSKAFNGCEALASLDLSKMVEGATIANDAFAGCKALAEIKLSKNITALGEGIFAETILKELNAPGVTKIDAAAFGPAAADREANTTLEKVVLGTPTEALTAYTFANCTALADVTIGFADIESVIPANFFYGCTALKAFEWDAPTVTYQSLDNDAFNKCTPNVVITTSNLYVNKYTAPKFTIYSSAAAKTYKTVADASGAAAAYGLIYDPLHELAVNVTDAKVYTVYVDEVDAIAYFTAMMPKGGKYYVPAGTHGILKTDEPKAEIPVAYEVGAAVMLADNVFSVNKDTEYAEFLSGTTKANKVNGAGEDNKSVENYGLNADNYMNATFGVKGNYLYRLSNNGGFGFKAYKKKLTAGQYFILLKTQPAAGRLQTVWLDENGNVEGDATGINTIVEKSENAGSIYNLAGQQVRSSYKGVVIQNGKKMILK